MTKKNKTMGELMDEGRVPDPIDTAYREANEYLGDVVSSPAPSSAQTATNVRRPKSKAHLRALELRHRK